MEPEVATPCSQAGLPLDGGNNQHIHKSFVPKCVLHTRWAGIKKKQTEGGASYTSTWLFPPQPVEEGLRAGPTVMGPPERRGCPLGSGADPRTQTEAYGKSRTQLSRIPDVWNMSSKLAELVTTLCQSPASHR